jgi:putative pre-16S rRNA nuclease
MMARVLAVDHGEKRIGLALSDETGTIAAPLGVLKHVSRVLDAARVGEAAREQGATQIVVGQSLDEDGNPNAAGRSAARFAEALRAQSGLPVILWDESLTTQDARAARLVMGVSRRKRSGHLDDVAAAVLLQSYLDAHQQTSAPRPSAERGDAGMG